MASEGLLGDRYRLDHVAGHGGMATVFSAYDTVLKRRVAIKLLQRRNDASGVLHERFRREALTEAQIVHPNVIAVHDVGVNEDGRPFIVMDYVEGQSLLELISEGPLSSERVAAIGLAIARALAVAHERGIVHRDIKPGNILIDAQGLPHLTDFGLARIVDDETPVDLTVPGEMLGTALYVAPEQARYGTVSPQADLYALGATLYHALAGAPPFTGNGAIDVAVRRFEEDPPDLVARVPGVDTELAALVHALLARDPAARPADAASIAERLIDVAARIHTESTNGETPSLGGIAVPCPPTTVSTPLTPPTVPKPNNEMLPSEPVTPVADESAG